MGCNCKGDKLISKLNKIMKKNVTYKLKNEYSHLDYLMLNGNKIKVDGMTQQMMSVLYNNQTNFVEIVDEVSTTNTYDKKKTKAKK
tara:strand:+ start:553 stop:810 length:258 start_codon:yes stop_codon:yes gene_type:complete